MNKRLLVAEDDLDDQLLLQSVIEELDLPYEIFFAANGVAVTAYLEDQASELPALIFLDLNMPKKDGRETLVEIKSNDTWKRIPTIIFTTSDSRKDIAYCYENGANAFVTKPVSYQELKKIIMALDLFWL